MAAHRMAAVARVMIMGAGCRGRQLAGALLADGHAVRVTTRSEQGRAAIEGVGAECWIGTPNRLATLRGALDGVTILCWMLARATGPKEELEALFTTRLKFFLTQAIDTTVRGFIYEAEAAGEGRAGIDGGEGSRAGGAGVRAGGETRELLARGEESVRELTARNVIPVEFLRADPDEPEMWVNEARSAIEAMLRRPGS